MDSDTVLKWKIHHGHNIKRLREMLGMKQEAIALELGITQQAISGLEQKELIDDETLDRIARIMNIPADAIKNMTDEATINYINTFNDTVTNNNGFPFSYNYNCDFDPIEKIVNLYEEKVKLYERIIELEKEKNSLLEKLLGADK